MAPQTTKQWTVEGKEGFDSLKFNKSASLPEIGSEEVLVKFHAASLNYRDVIIPRGKYGFPHKLGVVPGSDGAGSVEAVGDKVTRFKVGDRVATLFNQGHLAGDLDFQSIHTGLGGSIDGTFREYGVFSQQGLVPIPKNLNWQEASTLSCAALTAWNALYGLKQLVAGDYVLTEGTGGVSIFAVQFAVAAGAKVIATTSSDEKAATLKKLGATHVINYKKDPNWGETAKSLTPGKFGVQHIVEVGGPSTLSQALKAIGYGGVISIIGFIGGMKTEEQPSFLQVLTNICTTRGVLVGSREQFEQMNKAIETNDIHPVLDKKSFKLEDLKEAYQYMSDQKHIGKVTVQIDSWQKGSL